MQLILLATLASATEVVWLAPPDPVLAARIAERAGASGPPLTPLDLRVAATDAGPRDDAAIRRLADALRDAHPYETRLDGELLIMAGLARPIAAVGLLRDATDRDALFAALAYQGFAVDRYYGDGLQSAADAEPYRVDVDGVALVRPWIDALALDPTREIGPYDVAEAPQRVRFVKLQDRAKQLLPALLVPVDLPSDAALFVDGRPTAIGPSGGVTVPAGRHLAHVAREGRILARFDVRVAPGEQRELPLPLGDAAFEAWLAGFDGDAPNPPPPGLDPSIQALGGSVWVVDDRDVRRPRAFEVTADVVRPLDAAPEEHAPARNTGPVVSAAFGVGGGWLATWDFYEQDPANVPATRAAVNAGAIAANASADVDVGIWRFGVGLDAAVALGAYHVALYGDSSTRVRPYPHLAAGVRWVQATVGYLFPYNPGFGARGAIPLGGPVELATGAVVGTPGHRDRSDGTSWTGRPIYEAWAAIDLRL